MLDYAVVWEWVGGGRGELEEKKVHQRLLLEGVNDLVNTVVGLGNSGAGIAGVGSRGRLGKVVVRTGGVSACRTDIYARYNRLDPVLSKGWQAHGSSALKHMPQMLS